MRKWLWLILLVGAWSNAAEKNVTLAPIISEVTIEKFAIQIKDIVKSGNINEFKKIGCFPSNSIDESDLDYVFGKDSFIKSFLSNQEISIKIFGPYTYSDDHMDQSYSIVYYDPRLVKFNSQGYMDESVREKFWWKGYVETVVIKINGKWFFHPTPFYHGTDLPWAKD